MIHEAVSLVKDGFEQYFITITACQGGKPKVMQVLDIFHFTETRAHRYGSDIFTFDCFQDYVSGLFISLLVLSGFGGLMLRLLWQWLM